MQPRETQFITDSRARLLSAEDHRTFSRYCRNTKGTERLFCLYLLIRFTGLRISEALSLTIADVTDGFEIRRSVRSWTAKQRTKAKQRTLSLCSPKDILRETLARYIKPRKHLPESPLFATDTGKPWERTSCTHALYEACDRARIPRFSWHDLRHGYGQDIYDQTGDVTLATAALGHSSARITQKYLHPQVAQLHELNIALSK